jgi:SAM-dependent methyltransferase
VRVRTPYAAAHNGGVTSDDLRRLSAIAHDGALMWGPISESTVETIVERIADAGIDAGSTILDLGCGPAELLRRAVERTGAQGLGVDASPHAVEEAARRLVTSPAAERMEVRLADVHDLDPTTRYDLVVCIGPGWEHRGWTELASWCRGFLVSGGHLLIGDGAWRAIPSSAQLAAIGLDAAAYPPAGAVERLVRDAGIEPMWSHRATSAEWRAYEERYRTALLRFADAHPEDPLATAAADRAGPRWPVYEVLHEVLDFVIVLAGPSARVGLSA